MSQPTKSTVSTQLQWVLDIALITIWSVWVASPYLDFNDAMLPLGREFGMSIHPLYAWEQIKECGDCALWNGQFNGGFPTLTQLHASIAHPFAVVMTLLFGALTGAKITLIFSFVLAGLGQLWLGRVIGLSRIARIWTAMLIVVCGHLAGKMEHGILPLVLSTAACSMVLAPLIQVLLTGKRKDGIIYAVMLALALVSGQGYLQLGLILVLTPTIIWFLFHKGRLHPNWKGVIFGTILSGLLVAFFILPLLHFYPQFGKVVDPELSTVQSLWALPLNYVITDVDFYKNESLNKLPYAYLYVNYIGWIPVLLAIYGIAKTPISRKRLTLFFVFNIFGFLWISSGTPLHWLAKLNADFAYGIRHPSVIMGLSTPLIVALAGWGLDHLLALQWPTLSLSKTKDTDGFHLPLPYLLIPALFYFCLHPAYEMGRTWIYQAELKDNYSLVLDQLQTETTQWIEAPFGEHYWVPYASMRNYKMTNQIRPAHWKERISPPSYLRATYHGDDELTPEQSIIADVDNTYIIQDMLGEYAYIRYPTGAIDPCSANAQGGEITVDCTATKEDGVLYVKENQWSGWKAKSGKESLPLRNGDWLMVDALEGDNQYEFTYKPWDVWVGVLISIIAMGGTIYLWRKPTAFAFIENQADPIMPYPFPSASTPIEKEKTI